MDLSRRKLFCIGAVFAAAAAVPEIADAKPTEELVKPIILEHVCDGGRSRMSEEDVKKAQAEAPWMFRGCGTRFQWHWGHYGCYPNCGYCYCCTLDDLKTGVYKRIQ